MEPLIARLGDDDPAVRQAAGAALIRLGEGRISNAVQGVLRGERSALEELAQIAASGDRRAIPPLIGRLKDSNGTVVRFACEALGRAGDVRAGDALIGLATGWDAETRKAAIDALAAIHGAAQPAASRLLCGACLTRFALKTGTSERTGTIRLYACRTCGKSADADHGVARVVAVIDAGMASVTDRDGQTLRVNWLKRDAVFDFDEVEVGAATPAEVARLASQIAADRDAYRRTRYASVPCRVTGARAVDEPALAGLRSVLGTVVMEDAPAA